LDEVRRSVDVDLTPLIRAKRAKDHANITDAESQPRSVSDQRSHIEV